MNDIKSIEEKLKTRKPGHVGKHNFFSVMIPICMAEDGQRLLFEVRASSLKSQPGDICFPGGKIEKDETPLQCALREFEEETGIPEREAAVLGQFDTLHGFADYTLYTFVAVIDMKSLEKGKVNPAEVKELFTVPVEFFLKNPPKVYEADIISDVENFPYEETGISPDYNWRYGKNILPVYHWEDKIIWGMTARIVDWLIKELY